MAKNTGIPYEIFIRDLYAALLRDDRFATVEHNVKLPGKDIERQIDVLVRTSVAGHELLIVIECRDYASRLDITHLDAFYSKLQDVNASKGVLVSRRGFSKSAKSKADRVGVTLCLASEAADVLEEIEITIPVRANEIAATFDATMKITTTHANQSISRHAITNINGVQLHEQLHEELLSGVIEVPTETCEREWFPINVDEPYYVQDCEGNPVEVSDITITAKFGVFYYFGHLEDVPGLSAHHDMTTSNTTIMFGLKDVPNILASLSGFRSPDRIPKTYRITLNVVHVEEATMSKYAQNPTRRST